MRLKHIHERLILSDLPIYRLLMVKIIRHSGIDVAQREAMIGGNLINAQAHVFMPDGDVLHGDASSGNVWLAAGYMCRYFDMLI